MLATKYTVLIASPDKTPASCASALMQYTAVVGITEIFWTDNGPEYTAEVTQELTRILGGTWHFTLTYRPQDNGIVERQNQEILRHVQVLMLYQDTWETWSSPWILSLVQLSLNTRVHGSTGYTPVELTFGTAARQYLPRPQDLRRGDANALMDFNAALDNVQQAAMINIRLSQLPRLQRQPEVITNFEPGDLVLRDPRTNTGAARLLTNQLEPLRHRPYLVVEQERHGADITNTVVVRELNNLAKTHRFHHDTLSIFVGTIEQAQRIAQLDNPEFKIIQILSVTGNTSIRTDLTFHVRLEDGMLTDMPYGAAILTEAFRIFCAQFVFGRSLSLTREELLEFTRETKPTGPATTNQLLDLAGEEQRPETCDCRYRSA